MRLKEFIGDVLVVALIGGGAVGLYKFLQSSKDAGEKSARYSKPYEGVEIESVGSATTTEAECERYINRTLVESCREARRKESSKKH